MEKVKLVHKQLSYWHSKTSNMDKTPSI